MAVLKESKKQVTGCNSFEKEGKSFYRIEYIDYAKTGEKYTDKNGVERDQLQKVFKFMIVDSDKFKNDKNLIGKSEKEICQVLVGKSLVISTILE